MTSPEGVSQTPDSIVIVEARERTHEELEPERPDTEVIELDLGASPTLEGPTTRSGKKRKNPAPVKSTGKKKNKIFTRSPTNKAKAPTTPVTTPVTPCPHRTYLLCPGARSRPVRTWRPC